MIVEDVRLEDRHGTAVLSAEVKMEGRDFRCRIEYRYKDCPQELISTTADAFVAGLLAPAMRAREDLIVDAPVSPKLLGNVDHITGLLASFDERLSPVKVHAPVASPPRIERPRGIGLFFSAGVDSYYSLLKNIRDHPHGPDAITHLVFGHNVGGGKPYGTAANERLTAHMTYIAEKVGKKLLILETDLRQEGPRAPWRMHHGSALISAVLPLDRVLGKCIIASSLSTEFLQPYGSHPHLDPLFSIDGLEIVHDGDEAYRTEKMTTLVAHSELALNTLRVCFREEQQPRNCGRCRKCLQAMIVLHSLGMLDRCPAFVTPLEVRRVWTMHLEGRRTGAGKHLALLGDSKDDKRLARALRFAMLRHDIKQQIKRVMPGSRDYTT
jgi:hypothetical protein